MPRLHTLCLGSTRSVFNKIEDLCRWIRFPFNEMQPISSSVSPQMYGGVRAGLHGEPSLDPLTPLLPQAAPVGFLGVPGMP
jgi:hypothetical protein